MPGATPVKALPYPIPADPIVNGADAVKNLALALDDGPALPRFAAGVVTISLTAAASASVAITYPVGRFAATPIVTTAQASNSAAYCASNTQGTSSGFTGQIFHRDGTAATTNIVLTWHAVQMTPTTGNG